MQSKTISKLFVVSGLSNILGVLIFSKVFTNTIMMDAQPEVMGYFGLISILLWGMAYIAVRNSYASVVWLVVVFMLEKLVYVIEYVRWYSNHSIGAIYEQDTFAGIFYSIYGINDFIWMLFFGYVIYQVSQAKKS